MEEILNERGRIFDIQRFSVHDGPGVRTIVFLKGCPLRCRWCCNPESQSYEIEQMLQNGAVKTVGRDVTVDEVLKTVLKDRIYYRRSGGGMTLSGGEMLMQPQFAQALLKAAKQNGITTAVESTGFAPFSTIEKLLPYIDTFLIEDNLMWYAGTGICETRPDGGNASHIQGWRKYNRNRAKNFAVRNNVMIESTGQLVDIYTTQKNSDGSNSMPTFNNNIMLNKSGTNFGILKQGTSGDTSIPKFAVLNKNIFNSVDNVLNGDILGFIR